MSFSCIDHRNIEAWDLNSIILLCYGDKKILLLRPNVKETEEGLDWKW